MHFWSLPASCKDRLFESGASIWVINYSIRSCAPHVVFFCNRYRLKNRGDLSLALALLIEGVFPRYRVLGVELSLVILQACGHPYPDLTHKASPSPMFLLFLLFFLDIRIAVYIQSLFHTLWRHSIARLYVLKCLHTAPPPSMSLPAARSRVLCLTTLPLSPIALSVLSRACGSERYDQSCISLPRSWPQRPTRKTWPSWPGNGLTFDEGKLGCLLPELTTRRAH